MIKMIKKVSVVAILFYVIVSISYAKYKQALTGNGKIEVAKPILILDSTSDIKIDGTKDVVYDFSVKNYKDTQINEVNLNYLVQIINDSNANLEFTLYKNGEPIDLNHNKTAGILLSNLRKQEDDYKLKIKYNDNDSIQSDIYGNVQIKVEAVQENKE